MLPFFAVAVAGPLTLDDPAHRLDDAAVTELRLAADAVPFAVHAVVDDTAESEAKLAAKAKALREDEGGLVVAVDPAHRHTAVELDAAVGVHRRDFDDVRKAGNADFRAGRWGAGLVAIVKQAEAASHEPAPTSSRSTRTDNICLGIFLTVTGVAGALLVSISLRAHRRAKQLADGVPGAVPPVDTSSSWIDTSSSSDSSSSSSSGDSGGSSGSW